MIVTIAIDSWKGCLDSLDAARAIETGLRRVCPDLEARLSPLADGGEGTTCALCTPRGTHSLYGHRAAGRTGPGWIRASAVPPAPLCWKWPRRQDCPWCPLTAATLCTPPPGAWGNSSVTPWTGAAGTSSSASAALPPTTAAPVCLPLWASGCWNAAGSPIPDGAAGLEQLCSIDASAARPELRDCRFSIACDVENPLCGPTGASAVYGPQKGASPEMIPRLDAALRRFADTAAQGLSRL